MSQSAPQSGLALSANPGGTLACAESDKSITISLAIGKAQAARRSILNVEVLLSGLDVQEVESERLSAVSSTAQAELKLDLLIAELRAHRDSLK